MSEDRRHYKRITFDADVMIDRNGESWVCHLVDISLKGVLVIFPDGVEVKLNDTYHMEFRLGVEASINMHVKVVHINQEVIGLEWEDIDLDSLTHLRRLLELNMDHPEELHRELHELG